MYGKLLRRPKKASDSNNQLKKETMLLTSEENKLYLKRIVCQICKKVFGFYEDKKYLKVRDHCYYTGKYRCATHNICNLI